MPDTACRILDHAVRRGILPANVVKKLDRSERPGTSKREQRILGRDEIARLLDAADEAYRPVLAVMVFTGLRISEALGLIWADIDLEAATLTVRKQLTREGERTEPKTPQAKRTIKLMPSLVTLLREHRLGSPHSLDEDFVFVSPSGRPLDHRNVARRGLERAVVRAALDRPGQRRPSPHDLRHTAASLLIAQGLNVVFVSRQLGHASPDITLRVYAHLFDQAEFAERAVAALEASHGTSLERSGGEPRRTVADERERVTAPLRLVATSGV